MTVYIKHAATGAVHSVSDEYYNATDGSGRAVASAVSEISRLDGKRYPLPGLTVISEEEAREANPQLFGAWDPQVTFTPAELVAQATYQKQLAEFQRDHEANRRKKV